MRLGFFSDPVGRRFDLAKVPLSRRIAIRRTAERGAWSGRPWAVFSAGPQKSGGVYLPHSAPRAQKQAVGRISSRADIVFYFCFFREQFYCILFSFLSKFHIVSSIQIIPTKF
jgi:hypothetical protein